MQISAQDVRFLRSIRVSPAGFILPQIEATGPQPTQEVTTASILRRLQEFRDDSERRRPWVEE